MNYQIFGNQMICFLITFSSTSFQASVLLCSAFVIQLSHPYMTTGKNIGLVSGPLWAKWRLCFLIPCLGLSQLFFQGARSFNFMAAVTIGSVFGAHKNKVCHCFHCFPIYLPWSDGTGCQDLSFLNIEF